LKSKTSVTLTLQDLKDLGLLAKTKKKRRRKAKAGGFDHATMAQDKTGGSHFPFVKSEVRFSNSESLADEALRERIAASKRETHVEGKMDQKLDIANRFIPRGTFDNDETIKTINAPATPRRRPATPLRRPTKPMKGNPLYVPPINNQK
jgi:hypothetical protein